MKQLFALTAIAVLFISSCKKEDVEAIPTPKPEIPNYTPLTIGSYWVYDIYEIDTLGNEVKLNIEDSVFIKKDTIINGNTYFVEAGPHYPYSYLEWYYRDSLGYLVDHTGNIWFSSTNFTDTLYSDWFYDNSVSDTSAHVYGMMDPIEKTVTVLAGTFKILDLVNTLENYREPASDPSRFTISHRQKSEGIGTIVETNPKYWGNQTTYYEKRLTRYHIEK